jgi:hypothetical protein
MTLKIFVTGEDGIEEEIKDLYWFEEQGVHSFAEGGYFERYTFRFELTLTDGQSKVVMVQHANGTQEKDPGFK